MLGNARKTPLCCIEGPQWFRWWIYNIQDGVVIIGPNSSKIGWGKMRSILSLAGAKPRSRSHWEQLDFTKKWAMETQERNQD